MRGAVGGGEVEVHGNGLRLVNSDMVGNGPPEEIVESDLEWLIVSTGVVDGCCKFGIVEVFPPVEGVMEDIVDEDQETEGPDHCPLGTPQESGKKEEVVPCRCTACCCGCFAFFEGAIDEMEIN